MFVLHSAVLYIELDGYLLQQLVSGAAYSTSSKNITLLMIK